MTTAPAPRHARAWDGHQRHLGPEQSHFSVASTSRPYISISNKGSVHTLCLDDFEQSNNTAMLVPNTNTRARCTGDDESAPKTRDSTRRRCKARSRRHVDRRACIRRQRPGDDSPRPQDRRGGVRVRGAPFMSAFYLNLIELRSVSYTPYPFRGAPPPSATSSPRYCKAAFTMLTLIVLAAGERATCGPRCSCVLA